MCRPLERIWAPWRIGYVTGDRPDGCPFCRKMQSDDDEENLILHRGQHCGVLLNTYPYNSGHLMVVPAAHVGEIGDLAPEAHAELWDLTQLAIRTLQRTLCPQGLNVGMNLGQAAGAGISDHLHMHIVPRWNGDTNYMTSVAETRVVPQSLQDSYAQLLPVIRELATDLDGR
ncbi:MAG: HIT domain-containing protein [candidate division WS1 bacterium]|jgi:ATP adenylyltransferase|nr:HIT domain-containing protein [candidate division WS1 bacterium]